MKFFNEQMHLKQNKNFQRVHVQYLFFIILDFFFYVIMNFIDTLLFSHMFVAIFLFI